MQFRRRGDPKWGAEMTEWVLGGRRDTCRDAFNGQEDHENKI